MITAQLRGLYTTNMDRIEDHHVTDSLNFCVVVRAMVGPRGGEGEESFDINVCSPGWLEDRVQREGFLVGRHYLFVESYDLDVIIQLIRKFIERCRGESWQEVAEKVGRIGHWEFEE